MSSLKYGIVALAFALFIIPSVADAQNFQTLGRRRGAITGAILGAVIGDQNNEAFAGAAIGGLVGGTIGNVGGRNLDRQFAGGQPIYNYGGNQSYYRRPQYQQVYRPAPQVYHGHGGGYGRPVYSQPVYGRPVYGGHGGHYGGGGFGQPVYGGFGR